MRRRLGIVLVGAVVIGILPSQATAKARTDYNTRPARNIEAPADLNRIGFVRHWFGPEKPKSPNAILILVPGFLGGSENFGYVGRRLVTRNHGLQVWALDRRNNFLENRCGMEAAQSNESPQQAATYYLLGVAVSGCPSEADDPGAEAWDGVAHEYSLSQQEAVSVGMVEWGLDLELRDIRDLVNYASSTYPRAKVFLGGHSLGGMSSQLYAAWRFGEGKQTAGWHDLNGLVLIDGGLDGPNWEQLLVPQYFATRALVNSGIVFWDDFERGATPLLGFLAEIGGMAASLFPDQESFLWSTLPPPLNWPDPATCPTNKAIFAALTDDETGFDSTFMMHQGEIGDPVDANGDGQPDSCAAPNEGQTLVGWRDFDDTDPPEVSSTDLWASSTWSRTETNAVEWYFSTHLNADIDLASNLDSTESFVDESGGETTAEAKEQHRALDNARVKLPVFAFVTSECRERFDWYRSVAKSLKSFKIVDRSGENCPAPAAQPQAHLDPLFAADTGGFTNDFVVTLSKWLSRVSS
jgi:pimeloyl-ACP methyl ester carboxylesterase